MNKLDAEVAGRRRGRVSGHQRYLAVRAGEPIPSRQGLTNAHPYGMEPTITRIAPAADWPAGFFIFAPLSATPLPLAKRGCGAPRQSLSQSDLNQSEPAFWAIFLSYDESVLTFMSIAHTIRSLETQGALVRYVPRRTLKAAARRLYLAPRMYQQLNDPNNGVNLLVGQGEIEAALTLWASGEHIYDDGKVPPGPGFLKRLDGPPPEVWEFKVTAPTPQARVLGRFAEPDTFIASDMWTRQALGRKGSLSWKGAMQQCVSDWDALFPDHAPYQGTRLSDYVTENRDDFPLQ